MANDNATRQRYQMATGSMPEQASSPKIPMKRGGKVPKMSPYKRGGKAGKWRC
jgi:hypothetical protein